VSSAHRPASFGAIPATKDDSLPTDLFTSTRFNTGAAEGCDLLMLFFKSKIKRSQPSAAPTVNDHSHAAAWEQSIVEIVFEIEGLQ
jgi:hypothetical protein